YYFNPAMRFHKFVYYESRQLFVVHNQDAQFFFAVGAHRRTSVSAGSVTVASNLSPSFVTRRLASFPYRASSRSRTFPNPIPPPFLGGASGSKVFSIVMNIRPFVH